MIFNLMDVLHPLLKTTWYLRSSKQWCSSSRKLVILFGGAGLAQWWEGSPATNVVQVGFLDPASYVGWVCCWFSTLFSGYSGFPLSLKTNISTFQLDPGMHGHFWMSSCELPGVLWVNKLHLHFFVVIAAAVIVLWLGALFLLFVLLYSQRVASHSCETLRELLHHLIQKAYTVFICL